MGIRSSRGVEDVVPRNRHLCHHSNVNNEAVVPSGKAVRAGAGAGCTVEPVVFPGEGALRSRWPGIDVAIASGF